MPPLDPDRRSIFRTELLPIALERVAHELRTPLTSIRSAGEILRDHELTPEERRRFAATVVEENARLHVLLEDLLQLGTRLRLFA